MFWAITKLRLSLSLPQGNLGGRPKILLVGGHVDLQASRFLNRGIQAHMGRVE